MKFALWGFRKHDFAYQVVTAERAHAEALPVVATASPVRNYVTVAVGRR